MADGKPEGRDTFRELVFAPVLLASFGGHEQHSCCWERVERVLDRPNRILIADLPVGTYAATFELSQNLVEPSLGFLDGSVGV